MPKPTVCYCVHFNHQLRKIDFFWTVYNWEQQLWPCPISCAVCCLNCSDKLFYRRLLQSKWSMHLIMLRSVCAQFQSKQGRTGALRIDLGRQQHIQWPHGPRTNWELATYVLVLHMGCHHFNSTFSSHWLANIFNSIKSVTSTRTDRHKQNSSNLIKPPLYFPQSTGMQDLNDNSMSLCSWNIKGPILTAKTAGWRKWPTQPGRLSKLLR